MSAHIIVVDDDPKITALLKRSLTLEGYSIEIANDGLNGLKLALEKRPDLVILDIMLPGIDGWQVCKKIREVSVVPILMLTAKDEITERVQGLDIGADDYLVKPFELEELLARIRALLRRNNYALDADHPKVLRFEDLTLDEESREARREDRTIPLTTKEYDLLYLFMLHPRQVLTRDIIIDRVWGIDYCGESNVVEVYIRMLRQKLEDDGENRLIHTVRGAGYVLKE